MKKIVYLAPLALLGMSVKVSANQVPTHISNALRVYEQEYNQTQTASQSTRRTKTEQVGQNGSTFSNNQNQPIGKAEETTHISRLDNGLINEDSSVWNEQASQVMQIGRAVIPTKQELSESKESVAGQYVQVQQNRVAQFNKGSKIYGLNNSGQLNKNNGAGYVITNTGTYNGRSVDIGVTINNVKDNQGSYTTKWSNGDKADVTGKVDNDFNYQDSALVGTTSQQPQVDASRTRPRTVKQAKTIKNPGYAYHIMIESYTGSGQYGDTVSGEDYYIAPKLLEDVKFSYNVDDKTAFKAIIRGLTDSSEVMDGLIDKLSNDTKDSSLEHDEPDSPYMSDSGGKYYHIERCHLKSDRLPASISFSNYTGAYIITANPNTDFSKINIDNVWYNTDQHYVSSDTFDSMSKSEYEIYGKLFKPDYTWAKIAPVQVTDHLQLDQVNQGSLNYDYTIGVYDAQTGELIKDLTANYKGKTGKTATDQDTAMNNVVKAKIQAINANTANSAYTGTTANDDVTFSKNTVHVNYVNEQGQPINVPGYDIDVDNLTSGNYQVPQNYALVNTNGFKVTKNTHEVNGITVTDSYNFIDQGHNKVTNNGKTLSVVLAHGTTHVDASHSGLSNDATNNAFVINNGAKRQINSQSRHFSASGILDLVTKKITKQGNWLLSGKSNFDRTNINNDLVGYGNAIHSNLTFLAL